MKKIVNVAHLAKLTNIPISDAEVTNFETQFGTTLDTIATLEELDTDTVIATPQVTNLKNIFRDDVIDLTRQFTRDQALSNTTNSYQGYFVVPKVLHET